MFILKVPNHLKLRRHNDDAHNAVGCNKAEIIKNISYPVFFKD